MLRKITITWIILILNGCSVVSRDMVESPEGFKPLDGRELYRFTNSRELVSSISDQSKETAHIKADHNNELHHLSISGGGSDGAYAAAIMSGWPKDERPTFASVSGVSTGAIIGVFAFLGEEYDDHMIDLYTNADIGDLFRMRSILRIFPAQSVFDTSPFEGKVRDFLTPEVIKEIGVEREKGRMLLLGTVNLDSQQFVIWDLGKIAQYGTDESDKLVQDIVIASSSIPGAFPAKYLPVSDVDGQTHLEMHVDGGVGRQVFSISQWMDLPSFYPSYRHILYVINNGRLKPTYQLTPSSLRSIAPRSIDTLLMSQSAGDVESIYRYAKEHGVVFKLTYIGDDFGSDKPSEIINRKYMNELFDYGLDKYRTNTVWEDSPPSILDTISFSEAE
ncbi:Patatin-like phospholipase [Vibrio chagasii]|nr:Patatin-like phospholipase [Vibrio chagasii]